MPEYEYECTCGKRRTMRVSVADFKESIPCVCERQMRIVVSAPTVIFKGSFPSKNIKRKTEDRSVMSQAKKARKLKISGKIPHEERLKLGDGRLK